MKQQLFPNT